jgi:NADH-quinone oxidoreductase subunit I
MSAPNTITEKIARLWSLIVGLQVTGKYFTKPQVTLHYPRKTLDDENLLTYRGHIELVGLPKKPGTPKCISCGMCQTVCPSGCISLSKRKPPKLTEEQEKAKAEAEAKGEKFKKPAAPKDPATFSYDYTLCSLCGCCVENCPVDSIRFSNNIYLSATSRTPYHYDLLDRLKTQAGAAPASQTGDKPADEGE